MSIRTIRSKRIPNKAPVVFHEIHDNSAVSAPITGATGETKAYFPIYSPKGEEGKLKVYDGPNALADLIKNHGTPNSTRYGLPYSGAVLHAQLNGGVVVQTLKAPNATYASVVVMMRIKQYNTEKRLGFKYTNENLETNNYVDPVIKEFFDSAPKLPNTFIPDDSDIDMRSFFKEAIYSSSKDSTLTYTTKELGLDAYVANWTELKTKQLEISFELRDVNEWLKKNTTSNEIEELKMIKGINSPETLELVVQKWLEKADFNKAITAAKGDGSDLDIVVPIMWGYNTGKGRVGNSYEISFRNIRDNVDGIPLIQSTIRDKYSKLPVPESTKVVSFSNIVRNGNPVLLDSVYSVAQGFEGFRFKTAELETWNSVGEIIQTYVKKHYVDKFTDSDKKLEDGSYGPIGQTYVDDLTDYMNIFEEPEDLNLHRMSYIDLTRLKDSIFFISPGLTDYVFSGGDEGEFKFMKNFDWDFNFNDVKLNAKYTGNEEFESYKTLHGDKKIVQEMFIKAFTGEIDQEVFSLTGNDVAYVIDMNYPPAVKRAMYALGQAKDNIQLIYNTTSLTGTVTEQVADMKANVNFEGRNSFIFPGSFEWVDPFANRTVRVPSTFALIPNIINHYRNGFSESLAGIANGKVSLPIPYSGRGFGNVTLEEKDMLLENGINILSAYENGVMYLDSQKSNYKLDKVSSLQYFHNNSIINSIMKDIYILLQQYKHVLNSQNSVDKINEVINKELNKYRDKMAKLEFIAKFNDSYDKSIGFVTGYLKGQFNGTIEYFKLDIEALPITL